MSTLLLFRSDRCVHRTCFRHLASRRVNSFDAAFGLILSAAFLPRCSFHPIFLVRFPRPLSCVLPGTLQAMQYFWRVLDVYGEGRLTVATISLFFRDVARALKEGGFETPNTEDVKVQVW